MQVKVKRNKKKPEFQGLPGYKKTIEQTQETNLFNVRADDRDDRVSSDYDNPDSFSNVDMNSLKLVIPLQFIS